jgi:hypothetical protein
MDQQNRHPDHDIASVVRDRSTAKTVHPCARKFNAKILKLSRHLKVEFTWIRQLKRVFLYWSFVMLQVPSKAVTKVEINSKPELQRFLHRLPKSMVDRLTPAELSAYANALTPERSPHWIDLKASLPIPFFGIYVAVMAGRERRSWDRLRRKASLDGGATF